MPRACGENLPTYNVPNVQLNQKIGKSVLSGTGSNQSSHNVPYNSINNGHSILLSTENNNGNFSEQVTTSTSALNHLLQTSSTSARFMSPNAQHAYSNLISPSVRQHQSAFQVPVPSVSSSSHIPIRIENNNKGVVSTTHSLVSTNCLHSQSQQGLLFPNPSITNSTALIHHHSTQPNNTSVAELLKSANTPTRNEDSPPTPPVVISSAIGTTDLGMLAAAAALDTVATATSSCSSSNQPILPPKLKDSERLLHIQRWVNHLPVIYNVRPDHHSESLINPLTRRPSRLSSSSSSNKRATKRPKINNKSNGHCAKKIQLNSLSDDQSGDDCESDLPEHLQPPMDNEEERVPPPGFCYAARFPISEEEHQRMTEFTKERDQRLAKMSHLQLSPWRSSSRSPNHIVHLQSEWPIAVKLIILDRQTIKEELVANSNGGFVGGRNPQQLDMSVAHHFSEWETQLVINLFSDCFTSPRSNIIPSLPDVRSRIAFTALEGIRSPISIRAKIKRLLASNNQRIVK